MASFDRKGNPAWASSFDGDSQPVPTIAVAGSRPAFGGQLGIMGKGIAVDKMSNVFIAGAFLGAASFGGSRIQSRGSYDAFVTKIGADGRPVWAVSAGGAPVTSAADSGWDSADAVAVDPRGNCYVAGVFDRVAEIGGQRLTSAGGWDMFVAKFTPDGHLVWATPAGGAGRDAAHSIAVDVDGNSFITGEFEATAKFGTHVMGAGAGRAGFVAKLGPAGRFVWATSLGAGNLAVGTAITIDRGGTSYVTGRGQLRSDSPSAELVTMKVDPAGRAQWARPTRSHPTTLVTSGTAVAVAGDAAIVAGGFAGTLRMGSWTSSAKGAASTVVVKLGRGGVPRWLVSPGGTGVSWGYGLAVDDDGSVVLTGTFEGNVAFGGVKLSGRGQVFLWRFDVTHRSP